MQMTEQDIEKILEGLLVQYPEALRSIYRSLGVSEAPDMDNLVTVYYRFGDEFINRLDQVAEPAQLAADGTFTFKDIFDTALNLVTTGIQVKQGFENKSEAEQLAAEEAKAKEKIFGIPKLIFWGTISIIVLSITFFIIKKAK